MNLKQVQARDRNGQVFYKLRFYWMQIVFIVQSQNYLNDISVGAIFNIGNILVELFVTSISKATQ